MTTPSLLWTHAKPETTRIWEFKTLIEKTHSVVFTDYNDLYNWSIANLNDFWISVCHFTGVLGQNLNYVSFITHVAHPHPDWKKTLKEAGHPG